MSKLWSNLLLLCILGVASSQSNLTDAQEIMVASGPDRCEIFFTEVAASIKEHIPLPKNDQVILERIAIASGHNINDMGDYMICEQKYHDTQKYFTMAIMSYTSPEGYFGLCGPNFCSKNDYENSTIIIEAIKELLQKMNISSEGANLAFFDPDEQNVSPGTPAIIFLSIIIVGAIMLLAGSGVANKKKPSKYFQSASKKDDESLKASVSPSKISSPSESLANSFLSSPSKVHSDGGDGSFQKLSACFNLTNNLEELFKNERIPGHDENLYAFHAVRAIAFGFVILGHVTLTRFYSRNIAYLEEFFQSWSFLTIYGAFYAVDTFFWLSGFFTGFLMLTKLRRMKPSLLNYIRVVFHRWVRLWPAYFFCILFFWKVLPNITTGPLWMNMVQTTTQCDDLWYRNLLLIDNINSSDQNGYCFGWGWYIAVDFQIFLITPPLIWYYVSNKKSGTIVLRLFLALAILLTYVYAHITETPYTLHFSQGENFFGDFYINPLARGAPYLVGLYAGIMYKNYKINKERNFFNYIEINRSHSYLFCFIGIMTMLLVVYYPRTTQMGDQWSELFAYIWQTLCRPVFVTGLFLFVSPMIVGHLDWLRELMAGNIFALISKLTYTGYLCHYMVMLYYVQSALQSPEFSIESIVYSTFGILLVTLVPATLVHILIEKPVLNLDATVINPKVKKAVLDEEQKIQFDKIKLSVKDTN